MILGWSEWMEWSECTRTCNSGSRTRSRTCMNGQINDEGCRGPEDEAEVKEKKSLANVLLLLVL